MHGGVLNHGADLEPYVVVDGQIRDYQAVVDIANEAAKVRHFDCLRLLTCHSGEGGDQSIISNVSVALRKPVKGYIGGVYALAPQRSDLETANASKLSRALGRALPLDEYFDEQGRRRYCHVGQDVMAGIEFFPK